VKSFEGATIDFPDLLLPAEITIEVEHWGELIGASAAK
jgi:hypothetical protein